MLTVKHHACVVPRAGIKPALSVARRGLKIRCLLTRLPWLDVCLLLQLYISLRSSFSFLIVGAAGIEPALVFRPLIKNQMLGH